MVNVSPRERSSGRLAPTGDEEERAFLQERLRLLGAVAGSLTLVFYALVHVLAARDGATVWERWFGNPQDVGVFWVAVVYGLMWWIGRGGPRSLGLLRAAEGGLTVLACAGGAFHAWVGPDAELFRVDAMLAANNMLVVRAILLPSSARRTAAVGAIAYLPVVAPAVARLVWPPAGEAVAGLQLDLALFVGWAAVAIAVSTIVSFVVFDLRRRILAARQLGRYRLEERIGAGQMGEVYRASHAMLRRPTAIKLLRPERAGEAAIEHFEREVQLTAQLTHPNTVAIYDYGRTPDRVFYYAMEYLPGVDLERLVREDGPQDPGRVIAILSQVCGSLDEAHRAGLVHRDVKAANVILCERGGAPDVAKVVDFGLARVQVDDHGEQDDARVVGTPAYLSPEAFRAPDAVDARSDLYAVGILGYFLLCGALPFEGSSLAELCGQHVMREPDRPSDRLGRALPKDLEELILRCMAKDREERPGSAGWLRAALGACDDAGSWTEADARAWWDARTSETAGGGGDPGTSLLS
jgi:serine/threonine-protein kinase